MAVLFGVGRPYHRRWCKFLVLTIGLSLVVLWCGITQDTNKPLTSFKETGLWNAKGHSRQLQSVLPNCTPAAIEQFPKDIFSQEQRQKGMVVFHIILAAYMFLALAIACDDYFVPSLEVICDMLNLQTDVAGATFMAAGSSAPELATAVIAVFVAKDDIGLGTVVGSAVYNVTFVIGLCGLFAGMVLELDWWPLFRDCLFYAISVIALVVVLLDESVCWIEALVLILLYVLYIVMMYFNHQIETWMHSKFSFRCQKVKDEEKSVYDPNGFISNNALDEELRDNQKLKVVDSGEDSDDDDTDTRTTLIDRQCKQLEDEYESPLTFPKGNFRRFLWVVSLPLILAMFITTPDCRRRACKRWFPMTFIMSLVWLSIFSYLIVWMITVIGHTMGIPDTVMGLTFIAFGVSVPDAISSLIVVREGFGDMGVSNAVGSNIFDILICLGVPWLLETAVHNPGSTIQVYSEGLFYSAVTLLSTVALLLIATHVNGWKLNRPYGAFLMVVYILFMTLASLYELNVFGYFQPPECSSNY